MENKILKTLTLPNAQGELVKYDLAPKWENIEGKPENIDTSWENIEGKPESFPSDLTQASGILPIENGGTGNADGYIRTGAKTDSTIGNRATAEGVNTTASGNYSHAEGEDSTASGIAAHAEGWETTASGQGAHAEGVSTTASYRCAHAEGYNSFASGMASHAEGYNTIAKSQYQHVQGQYNIEDTEDTYAHIVGNGTSDNARSNAHTLDWDGNAWYAGTMTTKAVIIGDISYGDTLPSTGVEGQLFFLIGGSIGGGGDITATDDGNGVITLG